ncbi:CHASE domain-containing protein [Frigidibacter sp. ROC022]|uniref:CHASE domain-containing protein n=1 Tax=Frigidibacter sp. ROC022 TaxID=2971796 RepID=UPI00215B55C0|nr:CHASE domain-containing protein [Frigidibacter sp. ROC022]
MTNDNLSALHGRLQSYLQSLNGLAGLLEASDNVTAQDWRQYVSALKIEENLPGLTGLGIIVMVDSSKLDEFQKLMHEEGVDDLVIHPETGRDQKLVITYIEPIETNAPARGLDISFEEGRLAAAMASRDSGLPQATQPIQLVQDAKGEPGFLLMRPFYQRQMPISTVAERRRAFLGWVYAPYLGTSLLSDLTASQDRLFDLRVIDPDAPPERQVIFDSTPHDPDAPGGDFVRRTELPVYGRTWELEWVSTPAFDLSQNRYAKWLFLIAWLGLTVLLHLYLRSTHERQRLVSEQVEKKTRDIKAVLDHNRSIVANALVGILVLDGEDRILQANPVAEKLFGRDEQTLRKMQLSDLIDETIQGTHAQRSLVTAHSQRGKRLYLDIHRNLWTDGEGEKRQSVLIVDVTDETLANRALVESGVRWNLALKGAEIGIYDIDFKTNTSVVSDTWLELMGLPLDDPNLDPQKNFLSRVHPDDLPFLIHADRECIAGRTQRSISEYRVKFGDSWRWMHSDGVVTEFDEDGKALRYVGVQTDVTELIMAREALARSEDRFRLVLSNAPVGMAVMDLDGRLTDSNTAICNMTGYSEHELDGFQFVRLFAEDEVEDLLIKIANLQGLANESYSGEHRIIRKDGTVRWGDVKVSCVVDVHEGGEIYILQINDVTHQREVDRIKTEFIATVSHELRTPLTSIKGALGLVSDSRLAPLEPSTRRLIEIAAMNTDRLILLVNDILDLEKISAGKENFEYADISCNQLIRDAALHIRPMADKHKVRIVWKAARKDATVRADLVRIGQVLSNMLSNACKFSYPEGTVELSFKVEGSVARFSVVDHGEGVPDSFRANAFDRFSQADSSDTRRKGGTGLGLSISKQIVERMGGEIGFESVPGERTEFWFTCPLAIPRVQSKRMPPALPKPEPQAESKSILHLEKDAQFAAAVRASLKGVAEVVSVADVTAARKALKEGTYDVIILDWSFSDEQARYLLDDIDLKQPQARVVVLSSNEKIDADRRIRTSKMKSDNSTPEVVSWLKEEMAMAQQ